MSLVTKVVFPIPPPTTNDLSSHQRAQLQRKAKKLEQIFGVTPYLVDNTLESSSPIHIAFPRRPSQRQVTKTGRESLESTSSTSSSESSLGNRAPSVSRNSHSIHGINSRRSRASSIGSFESWPGKMKGPVVKLFMKAPTLETIPASPSPGNIDFPSLPLQSPIDRISDVFITRFTLTPDEEPSLRDSIIMDSYNITSFSSLRKQKMDRLRRKLGQNVPLDLVFQSDTDSRPSITSDLLADASKERSDLLPLPAPCVRTPSGRISTARDSIDNSASVHHAKRLAQPSSTLGPISTHNRSNPAPSKPRPITPSLSFIIESPDEHGIGCAEEFGQSRKPGNNTMFKSEWSVSTGGAEVKVWSTRRGYEGWCPKSSSTTTLQLPPITPPLPTLPSNTEKKKKPPSYRKPVPPISDDCY